MALLDVPRTSSDVQAKLHTRVPIEGAGVAHIITDPQVAETDVVLWRYQDGVPVECAHLSSCGGSASSAREMHMYWCDLETLGLLVRGLLYAVYQTDDDYISRKQNELFGWPL